MKRGFLLVIALIIGAVTHQTKAQIFSEDFSNGMPPNFTIVRNHSHTPASNVSYVNQAWVVRNVDGNNCAVSTSWFNPASVADDWMILPKINLPTASGSLFLIWRAVTPDQSYPDGYEVKISTTDSNLASFTTTLLTINAEEGDWRNRAVNLDAYSGQDVFIAFRNNSNDMYLLRIDDVKIEDVIAQNEAQLNFTNSGNKYFKSGNISVRGNLTNNAASLTSIDINYNVNNGATVSQTVSGISVGLYEDYNFVHSTPITATTGGKFDIKVWLSSPNGQADENPANDTISYTFYVVDNPPSKMVLLEEATGAWCGWCVDGFLKLEEILNTNPNVIGITVHQGDDMEIPETTLLTDALAVGYPTAFIDRFLFSDQEEVGLSRTIWAGKCTERASHAVPADISLTHTYNGTSREINATLSSKFYLDITGSFRVNLYLVQDSMSGLGSGWNQANYYNNNSNFPSHPYFSQPNPIVGFQHMKVTTKMAGGAWGAQAIPLTVTNGQTYTHDFIITLTPEQHEKRANLWLVATVADHNPNDEFQRPILNSVKQELADPVSIAKLSDNVQSFSVFPNPANDVAQLQFKLENNAAVSVSIIDMLGNIVHLEEYGTLASGEHLRQINTENFASGLYLVNIKSANELATIRLSVK